MNSRVYIQKRMPGKGWWYDGLQRELVRQGVPTVDYHRVPGTLLAGRLASKLGLQRNWFYGSRAFIAMTGWSGFGRWFPVAYIHEPIVYAMDCWEAHWPRWERQLMRHRVRFAMFSARRCAEVMAERIPGLVAHWVPEAVDSRSYNPGQRLTERSIDILEYGRPYARFTQAVGGDVANNGLRHLYPEAEQQLFSTHAQLRAALSDSKALVCYPRSDTEPQIAGSVETVTLRYFEAIASRALVIGRAPQELVDLFGYNPAIEIDVSDSPGKALVEALRDVERHQPLVDRNYLRLHEVATWDVRAKEIILLLENSGYVVR